MTERCEQFDADRCRCLRRKHDHEAPCDFSYTPWIGAVCVGLVRQLAEQQKAQLKSQRSSTEVAT